MFGNMLLSLVAQLEPTNDLQAAAASLLAATEHPDIVRWIEFPLTLLLFLLVPGDAASGAVYLLDRKKGNWYAADFEDEKFGGYTATEFDQLLRECGFLAVAEQPALWCASLQWRFEPVRPPEARV
jgi:hypothetical protein